MTSAGEGWNEYRRLVVQQLEDNARDVAAARKELGEKIDALRVDVVALKVKAGLWGAVAGVIPAAIAAAIWLIVKLMEGS